ncbi:class I SAM-dependent methyltransferase [Oryzobacter sp. 24SJ04S-52]|uniref:class I SAM-dependent methyltransferase n=1 Tax=Oryzobacter telluris TaxID=3149179 RepID=UPI00370D97A4
MFGDAAAYERYMGRWSTVLAPGFVDAVLGTSASASPASVMDVGCGTGNLSVELLARWPLTHVVAIDPSPAFVATARERLTPGRSRVLVGSAMQLPEAPASVDAALAMLVLNFLPDPVVGVAEMRRVTRPGGVLGAAVWDYGGGMAMLRTFWDAAAHVHPDAGAVDQALDRPARDGGLEGLFTDAGLVDVAGGLLEVPMHFPTFADYWEPFLLGIGPAGDHVLGLDDAGREALRAELAARLGDGPIEMTSTARWVRATVPA